MSTFVISICNEDQYAYVDDGGKSLSIGQTWSFSGSGGQLICGTILSQSTITPNYSAVTNYSTCGQCLSATTTYITANTIEDICVIVCDPEVTGGVATVTDAPHPVWIGLYGEQITQGNAVVLGGPNGLNS
jgi:hypothetical protein